MAPGEAPVIAAAFPFQTLSSIDQAPQSMAFFSTAVIERLCSGVTISSASAPATSSVKRCTAAGRAYSKSWL